MIDFARAPSLGDEIARLSAHIEVATARLLALIREFDASEDWFEEGFTSCARWLSWRTGIGPGAARERVRVAKALGDLPVLSAALGEGRLSYSVARALTRIATPENEAELVETARHTPAADLERLVGAWRRADRSEAEELQDERERHARRELWLTPDEDGSWRIRGRLDPEAGAVLQKALEAAAEALYGRVPADPETPAEARRADAIGLLAEAALGEGLGAEANVAARAERFQVVVHVSAETLQCDTCDTSSHGERSPVGPAVGPAPEPPRIEHGPPVSAETARRLACDAGVVPMTHDRSGNVLDVGRKRRSVPTALGRALAHRDGGCRFPGCRARFYDRHHVHAWTDGGPTELGNLVQLCRRHHWLVHEGGWSVRVDDGDGAAGEVSFHRPDGRHLPRVPEPETLPAEPVRELERTHEGLGLEIDPWSITPDWEGDRIDTDWALDVLR
jgi:hypothetical protein